MAHNTSEVRNLESRFQDDFNPFSLTQNGNSACVMQATFTDNRTERPDKYLASLEAKLNRLKGTSCRKINAKDMLLSLSRTKEDALNRFVSQDTTVVYVEATKGSEVRTFGELKRRMFPEQPLTSEDLQCLLESDSLNQRGVSEDILLTNSGGSPS